MMDEFKCRKASEKEDGRLGSQGFVYVMANKQPLWNEATQVYQLDFGGRVTQESAKNFQIELEGRQVGRQWQMLHLGGGVGARIQPASVQLSASSSCWLLFGEKHCYTQKVINKNQQSKV